MRKVGRAFKRAKRSGWWVRWTCPAAGNRICKNFHTKGQAEHFRKILYSQLNSDVFVGTVNVTLAAAVSQYLQKYALRGLSDSAETEARMSLRQLTDVCGEAMGSKGLSQRHIDEMIRGRKAKVSVWTVNKDIANVKAFINWGRHGSRRYFSHDLELIKMKTPQIIVTIPTNEQIRSLISRAPTPAWRMRLLISLTTGLRKKDVDLMPRSAIDLDRKLISIVAKKTGKVTQCPIAEAVAAELAGYLRGSSGEMVFEDGNIQKTWDGFRDGITRQDLRKTFATLIQRIGGVSSAQKLLGHSDVRTTERFYTDQELIMRWKINQLPIEKWLDK